MWDILMDIYALSPRKGHTKQWLLLNAHSWQELVLLIFDEMMMRSGLISWILVVLAHWNNSLQINMSAHSDTLSWFWASLCSFPLMLCNKYQFYSLWIERIGLKPTIYHTRGTPKKKIDKDKENQHVITFYSDIITIIIQVGWYH
jgi:hypothetical protein